MRNIRQSSGRNEILIGGFEGMIIKHKGHQWRIVVCPVCGRRMRRIHRHLILQHKWKSNRIKEFVKQRKVELLSALAETEKSPTLTLQ